LEKEIHNEKSKAIVGDHDAAIFFLSCKVKCGLIYIEGIMLACIASGISLEHCGCNTG